jgi:hypothetical protein
LLVAVRATEDLKPYMAEVTTPIASDCPFPIVTELHDETRSVADFVTVTFTVIWNFRPPPVASTVTLKDPMGLDVELLIVRTVTPFPGAARDAGA